MLACVALCIGTTYIINSGRARYAWVTVTTLVFLSVIELTAGYQNITNNYMPKKLYLNTGITISLMIGLCAVIIGSAATWSRVVIRGELSKSVISQAVTAEQN